MTNETIAVEATKWAGLIEDIVIRPKSKTVRLKTITTKRKVLTLFINFGNEITNDIQVGDIVEIKGFITFKAGDKYASRLGKSIRLIWTNNLFVKPTPTTNTYKKEPEEIPISSDSEFELILEELNEETKLT